jgi:hypothetical protein
MVNELIVAFLGSLPLVTRPKSRTDLSHCTPRRKIGVDEARDWLHLSKPG